MFTLSLDQVYSLDSIVFWGYHFGANNGNHPQSVRLEFSTHGGTTCGTPFEVTVGFPATFNLAATSTFTAGDANFVRMTVTDNQFETGPDGGDRVGIAEMRFLELGIASFLRLVQKLSLPLLNTFINILKFNYLPVIYVLMRLL